MGNNMARYEQLMDSIREKDVTTMSRIMRELPVEMLNSGNDDGNTPLNVACYNNNQEAVTALVEIEGIDVNIVDRDGDTPLHVACRRKLQTAVTSLLQIQGIDVNIVNKNGLTPLHVSCLHNNQSAITALLRRAEICVNIRNGNCETPIMSAARFRSKEALSLMLGDPRVELEERLEAEVGLYDSRQQKYDRLLQQEKQLMIREIKEERQRREALREKETLDFSPSAPPFYMSPGETHDLDYSLETQAEEDMKKLDTKEAEDARDAIDVGPGPSGHNFARHDSYDVEAARKELECPVCLEMMKPPMRIWMCTASHLVCETCKNQLENNLCPICRSARVNMRAFASENVARALFANQ